MRAKRIENMISYVQKNKTVTIEQLCEEFDVSINTVRRDINEIIKTGQFKKTYGGITYESETSLKSFSERHIKNHNQKEIIAAEAAKLVSDGDIIFIDSGTTTYYMIEHLKVKKDITILTNNLEAISRSISYPNLHVVSLPGDVNRKTLSFTVLNAANYLSSYNINKSFIATSGLSSERGITNSSPQEYEIKVMAISRSLENYVLVDYSKFNNVSLLTFNNFENINAIITDKKPDDDLHDFILKKNIEIIIGQS